MPYSQTKMVISQMGSFSNVFALLDFWSKYIFFFFFASFSYSSLMLGINIQCNWGRYLIFYPISEYVQERREILKRLHFGEAMSYILWMTGLQKSKSNKNIYIKKLYHAISLLMFLKLIISSSRKWSGRLLWSSLKSFESLLWNPTYFPLALLCGFFFFFLIRNCILRTN